jgi:hypothetical protein
MRTVVSVAVIALALANTQATASCEDVWDPPIADRPEITCAQFTAGLLLGLRGVTKKQVTKVLNAEGIPRKESGKLLLHYVSPQERLGGDMNFVFGPDDRVIRIFGLVDDQEFVWP